MIRGRGWMLTLVRRLRIFKAGWRVIMSKEFRGGERELAGVWGVKEKREEGSLRNKQYAGGTKLK